MDLQHILVYLIVAAALFFLIRPLIGRKNKGKCGTDCGCH
ncbi:MAG: FeoB-associated Cys-rich membrane protein [Flavobacteriaceae bacterium]|nr:FeoB-associated Cys-rich membrane protein [Flavobacteriaceae bacterium]MDP4755236.1 FeoB-associated Cys-rich membrane protein [Flavobacteriaceae bacterium]MDP4971843.1 FeoB-associated Cys-rich membrane protein [Flavobacteriaceae bacterium]